METSELRDALFLQDFSVKNEQHKGLPQKRVSVGETKTPLDKDLEASELHRASSGEETKLKLKCGSEAGCSSEPLSRSHSQPADWPRTWDKPPALDKPFRCSECGKTFRFNSALKKHVLVHSGEKPHRCCECGKSFQFVSDLRKHALIHSGERPHRCSICGKGFVDVSNFRRHERIHTGKKPFSCPFCEKDFTDKGNVKKHMRVHTGEKPFSCPVCKKDFAFLASYKRHVRIHYNASAGEGAGTVKPK